MPQFDPFIVVGTGRCGTSFVAKVLHETLGVSMGERFRDANAFNPEGYYEDMEFVHANTMLIKGTLTLREWATSIGNLIEERQSRGIMWGFKDPRAAELIGLYIQFFENPMVVWCVRPKELIVNSFLTKYHRSTEEANLVYDTRYTFLRRTLSQRDHLKIHFNEHRLSVEDVAKAIKAKWPRMFP